MMIKRTSRIAAAFLVFLWIFLSALPVSAGWETGIDVAEGDSQPTFSISDYRASVLTLVNAERTKQKLAPLTETDTLDDLADIRAGEAAQSFSHTRPDGSSCSTVFSDHKLSYSAAGENLSYGYEDPADLVAAWMASKDHRANLLNKSFQEMGLGCEWNSEGQIYCAQLLYAK